MAECYGWPDLSLLAPVELIDMFFRRAKSHGEGGLDLADELILNLQLYLNTDTFWLTHTSNTMYLLGQISAAYSDKFFDELCCRVTHLHVIERNRRVAENSKSPNQGASLATT